MNKHPTKHKPFKRVNGIVQRIVQPKQDREIVAEEKPWYIHRPERELEFPEDFLSVGLNGGPTRIKGIRKVGI